MLPPLPRAAIKVCIEVHIILGVFWSLKPAQVARLTLTLRDAFGNPLQSAPFLRGPVESRVKVLALLDTFVTPLYITHSYKTP